MTLPRAERDLLMLPASWKREGREGGEGGREGGREGRREGGREVGRREREEDGVNDHTAMIYRYIV